MVLLVVQTDLKLVGAAGDPGDDPDDQHEAIPGQELVRVRPAPARREPATDHADPVRAIVAERDAVDVPGRSNQRRRGD
jgi:hypothetical protein